MPESTKVNQVLRVLRGQELHPPITRLAVEVSGLIELRNRVVRHEMESAHPVMVLDTRGAVLPTSAIPGAFTAMTAELAQLRAQVKELTEQNQHLEDQNAQVRLEAGAELEQLRGAARRLLEASELGVSEADGMRRARALADLIGYDAGAQPAPRGIPADPAKASEEAYRLAKLLSAEVEVEGSGWAFALFLFREPGAGEAMGQVIQVSRDREKTTLAVARWLKDTLEARVAAKGTPA